MKHFPLLKTTRLTVQLRELSIGESIEIAGFPDKAEQSECSAFLRSAILAVEKGPADPAKWTVQERAFCTAYYLAITLADGPDFVVGDLRYSDYLDAEADDGTITADVGEIGGDAWSVQHLTGEMAEAIERLVGEINGPDRYHWLLGAMAAQLIQNGEAGAVAGAADYDKYLLDRMRILNAFPESDFETLVAGYYSARSGLHHLFDYDFSDDGIVILPRRGGAGILPARFPVRRCLSVFALGMAGKLG